METYGSMILGGEARNAEKLGAFVAWLITNRMFQQHVENAAGSAITRVRMHDLTGADFLSAQLHGELKPSQLNDVGRAFTEHYLVSGQYDEDYARVDYDGEDEWIRYQAVAPYITAAFQSNQKRGASKPKLMGKILKFPGRKRD